MHIMIASYIIVHGGVIFYIQDFAWTYRQFLIKNYSL